MRRTFVLRSRDTVSIMRVHYKLCFAFLLGAAACSAQSTPSQSTETPSLTVTTTIVAVPAVVRDKHGALENNLHREDFQLKVDNQPQPLRYFDHDADLPLTLGLLVDTSLSQRPILDKEKSASAAFLDKMLTPADKAFVMQFDIKVDLLQDVTAARPLLAQSLQRIAAPQPNLAAFEPNGPPDTSTDAGRQEMQQDRAAARKAITGTKLFDAVIVASNDITSKQPGRRALILLTDGGDYGSVQSIDDAIEAAQRADTIVYGIYYVAPFGSFRGGLFGPNGMTPTQAGADTQPATPPSTMPPASNFLALGAPPSARWSDSDSDSASKVGFTEAQPAPETPPTSTDAGAGPLRHLFHLNDGKKILEAICNETGGRVFIVSDKLSIDDIYAQIAEELRAQYRLGFKPTEAPGYHSIQLTLTGPAAKGKHTVQTRDGFYIGPPTPAQPNR